MMLAVGIRAAAVWVGPPAYFRRVRPHNVGFGVNDPARFPRINCDRGVSPSLNSLAALLASHIRFNAPHPQPDFFLSGYRARAAQSPSSSQ